MDALGIFLLLAISLTVVSATEVTIEISSNQVTPGDDVTVQCTLSPYQIAQYINWYKRQEEDWVVIGTPEEIIGDFASTQRYSVENRAEGDDVHFILHIRGVRIEDSGDIACAMGQVADSQKIFKSLIVAYPPSKIQLFSMDSVGDKAASGHEYRNGDRIKYKDGESLYFQCKTSNSNPPTDFIMSLGERIFTSYFEKTHTRYLRGATPGLLEIYYETVATTFQAVNITKEAREQNFTCAASVHNYQPISISITPYVILAPDVECQPELLAEIHAKDQELSCTVKSTEMVTEVYWMYLEQGGSIITLKDKETEGHYSARMHENEGVTKATLLINMVAGSSFREYTLVASSDIGTSQDSVLLRRDISKESTGAGGRLRAGATLLPLLAAIISYLHL